VFDDAKYMAKDAVERNNALSALDQMREETSTPSWARPVAVRRLLAVVASIVIAAAPLVTALENPRWFVVYVLVVVALVGIARSATRAARGAIGKLELTVLAIISFLSVLVALSAQTDTNLQAGVTATAGIGVSVIAAAVVAPSLTRLWRPATS
jgi:hypothetical protein